MEKDLKTHNLTEIKKKYPTFCILPFTQIGSSNDGNYRICCVSEEIQDGGILKPTGTPYNMRTDSVDTVWNTQFYKQLRSDMLNGIQNSACEYCWNYENSGAYSKRMKNIDERIYMYNYQEYIDIAIENDNQMPLPSDLDIRVGTLCNLKCITCYPGASSLHYDELTEMQAKSMQPPSLHQIHFIDKLKQFNIDPDQFNPKNIDPAEILSNLEPSLKLAKHMSIVGGEPLVNKTTMRLLEYCVEQGYSKNMMLQIITNMSVINNKIIDLLLNFDFPMLCVSWDHVDEAKFNYIRYPLEYRVFRENFSTISQYSKIQKKLSTTWSIFNIFDFEAVFDEWERVAQSFSDDFVINHGLVYYPNYFSLRYLEPEQKQEIVTRTNEYLNKNRDFKIFKTNLEMVQSLQSIGDYMGTQYSDHHLVCQERTRVLKQYDILRNSNYRELFPYIKDYE